MVDVVIHLVIDRGCDEKNAKPSRREASGSFYWRELAAEAS
jgi:hypothetical protein